MAQTGAVQLPLGYEDATPVAASTSGISLPPGYEDAKPVTAAPTSTMDNIGAGAKDAAGDIAPYAKEAVTSMIPGAPIVQTIQSIPSVAKTVWDALPPVQLYDATKQTLPVIQAYEKARSGGASIGDAIKASDQAARQHASNINSLQPVVDAFRANPTRETARVLIDTAAAAASLLVGGGAAAEAAPEAAAAEAGAAETEAPSIFQRLNPFRKAAPTAAATSKIEPVVDARTAKAGLPEGAPGVTPAAAAEQTAQSTVAAQTATQANVDKVLQSLANDHAAVSGLKTPAAGTATRDLLTVNGDALVDAGKAQYKILDQYTNGQFTNAQQELKNAQLELRAKAGTTDADMGTLEANVTRAQWKVDHLFDDAVKQGMPKETADLARNQFRTGQATLDIANDVRIANKVRGGTGARMTDLNALENRWTARYDSGRLQQALGDEGAKAALAEIRATREAGEVFQSMPSTESQALRDLIAKHTETGKFGVTTDWKGVRKDFSTMPDRAARFSDVPKVEKFINDQRFYQNLRHIAGGTVGAALAGGAYEVGKALVQ